jgi:hypothetical protein
LQKEKEGKKPLALINTCTQGEKPEIVGSLRREVLPRMLRIFKEINVFEFLNF